MNKIDKISCYPLSRSPVEIINPLTGKSSSYVKNSAHFVERISDAPIDSNQMVSLDVVSLFTKVPTDETLAVVRDKLAADPLLEERTCIPIDHHHHHHIVLAARISLTLSRHSSLSFIALGRSSGQQPVSSHSC